MEGTVTSQRPDVDIEEDIREFTRTYDPLKQARGHFEFSSQDGHVILQGHVRTMQARRVLVDNVPDIPGVASVDDSQLYDDETLRISIGNVLPPGVLVRVNYGSVAISAASVDEKKLEALLNRIRKVPGVQADRVKGEIL